MTDEITITVDPKRLDRERGDIASSFSGDTICYSSKIRKPFTHAAKSHVTTGILHPGHLQREEGRVHPECTAYQLLPKALFNGAARSYNEIVCSRELADAARLSAEGFYHGMTVSKGKEAFVLVGPPVLFVAAAETAATGESQLDLF